MSEEEQEISVANAYCVVYTLEDNDWKVKGEGWSQVHLYQDKQDNSYRIVGWTVEDSQVVINCNVTLLCQYKKKSLDFYKFIDEETNTYGFGFYKKNDTFAESEKFMEAVIKAINTGDDPTGSNTVEPISPIDTILESSSACGTNTTKSGGSESLKQLAILEPKTAKLMNSGKNLKGEVSEPSNVRHEQHVEFDPIKGTYQGVPKEWQEFLNKQFGVPLNQVESIKVKGYSEKIPKILVTMKKNFEEHDGASADGIFRIAPDGDQSNYIKEKLNRGDYESCEDIHCMANLIKVFFRELPGSILSGVDPENIINCTDCEKARAIVVSLKQPNRSIFCWLLDFILTVAEKKDINRMTEQNLAIVIAPNICEGLKLAPTLQLVFASKAAKFMRLALEYRRKCKDETVEEKSDSTG